MIDTSAVLALHDPGDRFHRDADTYFRAAAGRQDWCVVDVTSHETFTRVRYDRGLVAAMQRYSFLRRNRDVSVLRFIGTDEPIAERLLNRYVDVRLSFHDAICAAVMMREGIPNVFSFDSDFAAIGFQVLPGPCA
jgi:predicted nucleic acid-binding protein